ncbi:hypothetical protein LXL04_003832 [Taraxacum kok-saghyz]
MENRMEKGSMNSQCSDLRSCKMRRCEAAKIAKNVKAESRRNDTGCRVLLARLGPKILKNQDKMLRLRKLWNEGSETNKVRNGVHADTDTYTELMFASGADAEQLMFAMRLRNSSCSQKCGCGTTYVRNAVAEQLMFARGADAEQLMFAMRLRNSSCSQKCGCGTTYVRNAVAEQLMFAEVWMRNNLCSQCGCGTAHVRKRCGCGTTYVRNAVAEQLMFARGADKDECFLNDADAEENFPNLTVFRTAVADESFPNLAVFRTAVAVEDMAKTALDLNELIVRLRHC